MTRYELSRHHIACMVAGIMTEPPMRTADELMGYAHGLEDAAYRLKGLSNEKRREEEEAAWGRLVVVKSARRSRARD